MTRAPSFNGPLFLGFEEMERIVERLSRGGSDGYPPYNIEKFESDGIVRLRITLAVAGFTEDEIEISLENKQLLIRGKQQPDQDREYLYRGIATRQFQRSYILADGLEVEGAELDNGLLAINLFRHGPSNQVQRIKINSGK